MKRALFCGGLSLALTAAACGGGSKQATTSTPGKSSPAARSSAGSGAGTMVEARTSKLGRYLTDSSGRTVYLFEKDRNGKSACAGACAKVWSPLTTSGKPSAGSGVKSAMLSAVKRPGGAMQVVYGGHPLYHYDDDHRAGQMEGEASKEFGAEWYVVSPAGVKVEKPGS
jgi:predicted lipoprotein with Yx(FWY)xxD motif